MQFEILNTIKETDVSIDTIRYYEREGLMTPISVRESGYRVYDSSSINLLLFIRKAKSLGFSLGEIKTLLAISTETEADCEDIQAMAREKMSDIDRQIADLAVMKNMLSKLIDVCPGKGRPLDECSILEYFYGEEQ